MLELFTDIEQGSDEWFRARMGIPTASNFMTVMASGKGGGPSVTRRKYMLTLAGEILTEEPAPEGYRNADMDRGHDQEDEARALYALTYETPTLVGFIKNGRKGASPDSLLGDKGGLEIKCAIPSVQIERLIENRCPPEHVAQVQGNMWVAEREWWDFVSYSPRLPMLRVRVPRDNSYIATMAAAVDAFNIETTQIVETIRRYGTPLKDQLSASLRVIE